MFEKVRYSLPCLSTWFRTPVFELSWTEDRSLRFYAVALLAGTVAVFP